MSVKEKIEIELQYDGLDVDDGTMSLEDMVPALQGFSSAYGKIAILQGAGTQHKIRVTGVKKGTFHVVLEAWSIVANNTEQLQVLADAATILGVGGAGAHWVVKQIIGVVQLTKHTKKKPYTEKINADNQSIIISNSENVTLEVPIQIFKIYKEGLIAQDLNKIAQPLEEGKIDSTQLKAKFGKEEIKESISLDEKKFFDIEEIVVTETKEMWLSGILNSLTKTTNRGYFYLNDGTRVSYKLGGKKPEEMYKFFIYKGPVKVRCVASLDENLKPAQIEIFEIVPLQDQIFNE